MIAATRLIAGRPPGMQSVAGDAGSRSGLVHAFEPSVAGGAPPPGHGAMFVRAPFRAA